MKDYKSEKSCMIYVSDYHFEMIGLLNIRKDLKENKKVIILTQNNLTKTAKTVISKINLKDEERETLENLDWTNNIDKISKDVLDNGNISIYIKGNEDFIRNQNDRIKKILFESKEVALNENSENYETRKISIVDCYNYFEIEGKANELSNKYKKKLTTSIN